MVQTPEGEKICEMKPGEKIRMTKDEKKELIQALTYAMKDEVLSKCREESFKREFEAWKKANNIQTMKDVDRYVREIR